MLPPDISLCGFDGLRKLSEGHTMASAAVAVATKPEPAGARIFARSAGPIGPKESLGRKRRGPRPKVLPAEIRGGSRL